MTNEHKLLAITNPTLYALYIIVTSRGIEDLSYIAYNLVDFYEIKAILNNEDLRIKVNAINCYKEQIDEDRYENIQKSILKETDIEDEKIHFYLTNLANEIINPTISANIFKAVIDIFGEKCIKKLISKDF